MGVIGDMVRRIEAQRAAEGVAGQDQAPALQSRPTAEPSPWPATLAGLGKKRKLGAIKPCLWCGTGTFVRYAALPTCLYCARSWPGNADPEAARAYLWRLLDLWNGMDEATWPEANVKAIYDDVLDLFREHPEANAWFRAWRAAHPEARLA